jgi:hypothetical protein
MWVLQVDVGGKTQANVLVQHARDQQKSFFEEVEKGQGLSFTVGHPSDKQ